MQYLFDLEHEKENRIKIFVKNKRQEMLYDEFDPYFYFIPAQPEKVKKTLEGNEKIKKIVEGPVLKIFAFEPSQVPELRKELKELGETREDDIPFVYRYLIDKDLYACRFYDLEIEKGKLVKAREVPDRTPDLKIAAFDIEVYNKKGIPDPEKDPVLLISYVGEKEKKVFWWDKKNSSEKEVIQKFVEKIKK